MSPVLNRCVITSYGVRKKFLVRSWSSIPTSSRSSACRPTPAKAQGGKVIDNKEIIASFAMTVRRINSHPERHPPARIVLRISASLAPPLASCAR